MHLTMSKNCWRVDLRPECKAAVEFEFQQDAETLMDLIECGIAPKAAILETMRRMDENDDTKR